MWGTCEADYTAFTAKWKDILDANITESFAANFSDKLWIYGLEAPRRELVRYVHYFYENGGKRGEEGEEKRGERMGEEESVVEGREERGDERKVEEEVESRIELN